MKSIYLVFEHFIELHLALYLVVRLGGRLLALARAEHHAAAVLPMVDGLILNFIDRFHSYNHIEHAIYSEDIANDHYHHYNLCHHYYHHHQCDYTHVAGQGRLGGSEAVQAVGPHPFLLVRTQHRDTRVINADDLSCLTWKPS